MKRTTDIILIGTYVIFAMSTNAYANGTQNTNDVARLLKATVPTTPTVPAKSPLSGNFSLLTNYMFRGISSSNDLPAVQGSLTYTFPTTGIYFSVWGSNTSFIDTQGNTATVEMDPSVGITNTIGENFTYNILIDRYTYPRTNASYGEFITNLTYYFMTAQYAFSNNVYSTDKNGSYYNLGFTYPIPANYAFNLTNLTISGGVGHYSLPKEVGLLSYNDYNLQLSKTIGNYALAVQWTDTNGRSVDAFPLKNSHVVASVTVNF